MAAITKPAYTMRFAPIYNETPQSGA